MDFEEQLEKAEKSPYPSLVGASVKSADDSPHKNYIHPEKYTGTGRKNTAKKSILNSSIGASLDDLISEGALLGSDENFDRFLDDKGNVLSDAKFSTENSSDYHSVEPAESHKPSQSSSLRNSQIAAAAADDATSPLAGGAIPNEAPRPLSELENYSTPNLSEYQIGHQISDHSELLDSVKSYDLSKLPTANDTESRSMTNVVHPEAETTSRPPVAAQNAHVTDADSLHAPYFHTDERSSSRSRARVGFRDDSRERSRSRSCSVVAPHLARGDTYKNTHEETPSKYELPAGMEVDEDAEVMDDRRSRQSKPTLGDSIAAAEATKVPVSDTESVTRDPSLVTSGDYKNFNADGRTRVLQGSNLYSLRSESSTNYLRSISRSRSRKPANDLGAYASVNEKNDANPQVLEREGALVSDDPFSQVDDLDNMMKKVLKESAEKSALKPKNLVNDVPAGPKNTETMKQLNSESILQSNTGLDGASHNTRPEQEDQSDQPNQVVDDVSAEEKDLGTSEQLIAESAPTLSAKDIHVEGEKAQEPENSVTYPEGSTVDPTPEEGKVNDVSAEEKDADTQEQLKAEEAPVVSASNIHVNGSTEESETKAVTDVETSDVEKEGMLESGAEGTKAEDDSAADLNDVDVKPLEVNPGDISHAQQETEAVENGQIKEDAAIKEIDSDPSKNSSAETPESKIDVAEQPTNLITEPDTIGENSSPAVAEKPAETAGVPAEKEEDFEVSAEELRQHLESLPVYLYTSLAGGMQIITRTNRLATILQANGIKFEHRDLGTDEEAKKLWRRYAQGKTLPGVVRGDDFIGNWEFIEEVNEDYRLKEVLHETL
ncbi:hypothetical protein METBIDRAFT_45219 [Metschnikowia bicuspidata var. bicuspidata NRRL YB-4993]|uniref:Uncharacterized protein n=1 Tax=Metschnikowia bicuspidata var. bicuspidata NRRL YB-4993 TaxID=869754 RepID=A0A1A0H8E3_9ASCO|nr:hypothetical protein METBIDRAFT_45219 [Metschnikowia bicuspidata var. bicuspidata NRRL YB-4993]OBA20157.1 hypothetical protein METBIDRAFT_45219 [Metschnikowia bicuspidata var. bicuspidata NRRL YB-4993]